MLAFVVIGIATVAVGFSYWQPLPGEPRPFEPDTTRNQQSIDARTYLRARPFDALAYVGLAHEISATKPPTAQARALSQEALRIALQLAPVDPVVMRGRIADAYSRNDLTLTMTLASELAALSPADRGSAFALLGDLMRTPEWSPFLASRLANDWAVADAFVAHVCQSGGKTDVLLPLAIALGKRQTLLPSTLNCVAAKSIADNQTPVAYWLWLNSSANLPKKIGFVLNGDFESPLSGGPFDWMLGIGGDFREGFTVGLAREDAAPAAPVSGNGYLAVRFNGRAVRSPISQQNLALKVGRYRLSYRYQMSGLTSDKLNWSVRCGSSVLVLGSTSPGDVSSVKNWGTFSAEFTVAPECSGQLLSLEVATRLDSLQGLVGTAKYDDIIIRKL